MAGTSVNYDDPRFKENEKAEKQALDEVDVTFGNMIKESDEFYDDQIEAVEDYGKTQAKNQQEQTDLTIEQINQQKDQTKKDYTKEQAGAYVDWQRASDPYGVNAEKVAASGLTNSGYADSLQTQRYVTYQNRVATARETYNKAVLEYDNMIKEAKLQNNAILAEIAFNTLQAKLSLSLEGFQYENSLIIEKANTQNTIKNNYYTRYKDIVDQINTENALAEEKRQFNETIKLSKGKTSSGSSGSTGNSKINKSSGNGWDNGSVSTSNIKTLQKALGVTADGKWGSKSTSAAGGMTADEAWKAYQSGTLKAKVKNNEIGNDTNSKLSSYNIEDLGFGPITPEKASELVDKGMLTYTTDKNGKVRFTKVVTSPQWNVLKGINKVK